MLTFLDAHCECTDGWLEPLLASISKDRRSVPAPTIDVIEYNTFSYKKREKFQLGGIDPLYSFKWYDKLYKQKMFLLLFLIVSLCRIPVPQHEWDRIDEEITQPFLSPAMAGGLFSIDREFFYEIGTYDEEMKIWGAENTEMSFRVCFNTSCYLIKFITNIKF